MTHITQLGYLVFQVRDVPTWETFATSVLGLTLAEPISGGSPSFRMDRHSHRILLEPGDEDDLGAIGWEVRDDESLLSLRRHLEGLGVSVEEASSSEARSRRVGRLLRLHDPSGVPVELYIEPELSPHSFASPLVSDGFVADSLGLGHAVLSATDLPRSLLFWKEGMGMKESDRVVTEFYGHAVDITFFHVNPRHHSLALAGPMGKRLVHFLLEARSLDEVGKALDRALAAGVRIRNGLGRHPNDHMFSFYARTPSGFEFEFGWGGRLIEDEASWVPTVYDRISDWGHHPPPRASK